MLSATEAGDARGVRRRAHPGQLRAQQLRPVEQLFRERLEVVVEGLQQDVQVAHG